MRETYANCKLTQRNQTVLSARRPLLLLLTPPNEAERSYIRFPWFLCSSVFFPFRSFSVFFLSSRVLHHNWADLLKFGNMIDFDITFCKMVSARLISIILSKTSSHLSSALHMTLVFTFLWEIHTQQNLIQT